MAAGDASRLYHELTSYKLGDDFPAVPADHPLVLQDLVTNDFALWPYPYKRYPDYLPRTALPRELDQDPLARLLFLSSGVVRTTQREGRPRSCSGPRARRVGASRSSLRVRDRRRRALVRPEAHALVHIGPPPTAKRRR